MSITANWSYPTAIKFGAGRIKELADHCKAVGMKKPLLVTDRGLAPMAITQNALDILDAAGLGRAIFADVDPNPNDKNLDAGVKAFKDGNVAYAQKDWKKAVEKYEVVIEHEDSFTDVPQLATAYFFLGNSYDQLYKPAKQGDAVNDSYIQKAIDKSLESASQGININGGKVVFDPLTSGMYQGMSIFQNRTADVPIQITGQGGMTIYGTFYTAAGLLQITGSDSTGVDVIGSQYISRLLQSGGNGKYKVDWRADKTAAIRQLNLVE